MSGTSYDTARRAGARLPVKRWKMLNQALDEMVAERDRYKELHRIAVDKAIEQSDARRVELVLLDRYKAALDGVLMARDPFRMQAIARQALEQGGTDEHEG